ncbi:MAG: hypothetical protein AAFP19_18535 [Bacteroidota bacterium]
MTNSSTSVFEKAYNPVLQAAIVFGLGLTFMVLAKLVKWTGIMSPSDLFPWTTAASFMLFFSMFNSIFSLSAKNLNQYWNRSIISFMGLAVMLGLIAWLFSAVAISDAGSMKWIYIVLTLGYLIFLSMVGFIKRIVEFAQREEWNQPRKRRK